MRLPQREDGRAKYYGKLFYNETGSAPIYDTKTDEVIGFKKLYKLFTVDCVCRDGGGIQFMSGGRIREHSWCHPHEDKEITDEVIIGMFLNGFYTFGVDESLLTYKETPSELVKKSIELQKYNR